MIILMQKQFESKFLHDALLFWFNLNILVVSWRAKRTRRKLGFWRLKLVELVDKRVLGEAIGDILFVYSAIE